MAEQSFTGVYEYTKAEYVEGCRAGDEYFKPAKIRLSWSAHAIFAPAALVGGPLIIFASPSDRSGTIIGSGVLGIGIWSDHMFTIELGSHPKVIEKDEINELTEICDKKRKGLSKQFFSDDF